MKQEGVAAATGWVSGSAMSGRGRAGRIGLIGLIGRIGLIGPARPLATAQAIGAAAEGDCAAQVDGARPHRDRAGVKPAATGRPARASRSYASALSLVCGMLLWELGGRLCDFAFLPPFSEVLQATWRLTLSGEVPSCLAASLLSLLVGYALAVGLGVPVGLLMGRFRTVESLLDPYFTAFLAAPNLVYVPVLFALFGASRTTQLWVVFLHAFFIIAINTTTGVRSVEQGYEEMARSFCASESALWRKVLLPGAVPLMVAGLHLGLGRGIKGMVNGEMLIAFVGLGALLRRYGGRFDAASVFGLLIVVIALALLADLLLRLAERRLVRWPDRVEGGAL